MRIAVVGLWHLGVVTAAGLAQAAHDVVALDDQAETITHLRRGLVPVSEPGLPELVESGQASGQLRFATNPLDIQDRDVVWVTYDTPVDATDRADVEFVIHKVAALFPYVAPDATVLISSQLPVGTTARLEALHHAAVPGSETGFAYSPENLRLGRAIESFTRPARIVVGVRSERDRQRLTPLLAGFNAPLLWMSIESAEMAKHALNAFLALSVAFANELAVVGERVGADARDVERALRSDERIGPAAYVRAGAGFAGGTLGRDLSYLIETGERVSVATHLLEGVRQSNARHLTWVRDALLATLEPLVGRRIAVLGLAYKPGTDTLRRSSAVETCQWLAAQGATVTAFDPALTSLPVELSRVIDLRLNVADAVRGTDAVVVATEWPDFARIRVENLVGEMRQPVIIDPGRFLEANVAARKDVKYLAVGRSR